VIGKSVGCGVIVAWALSAMPSLAASVIGEKMPVVRASSTHVDVDDNGRLLRGIWTLSTDTELDTYYARRAPGERQITFSTDVDSISFDVVPGPQCLPGSRFRREKWCLRLDAAVGRERNAGRRRGQRAQRSGDAAWVELGRAEAARHSAARRGKRRQRAAAFPDISAWMC